MNGKLIKALACTVFGACMATASVAVNAGDLSADRAQRLIFTPQNDDQRPIISANQELVIRVDGLDLPAKRVHGVDISACKVTRVNPGENVIAAIEVTDAKNGAILIKAGPASGIAKLHLKCRNKQASAVIRVI